MSELPPLAEVIRNELRNMSHELDRIASELADEAIFHPDRTAVAVAALREAARTLKAL